jgi:hypothetical protein
MNPTLTFERVPSPTEGSDASMLHLILAYFPLARWNGGPIPFSFGWRR